MSDQEIIEKLNEEIKRIIAGPENGLSEFQIDEFSRPITHEGDAHRLLMLANRGLQAMKEEANKIKDDEKREEMLQRIADLEPYIQRGNEFAQEDVNLNGERGQEQDR